TRTSITRLQQLQGDPVIVTAAIVPRDTPHITAAGCETWLGIQLRRVTTNKHVHTELHA
ncbi:hypothetical protein J6590_107454, partial [Homalodisca vitripennis]